MDAVDDFDLTRYLGDWHQVAAIPAWFQDHCSANTTANYSLDEDGLLRVLNACETADGAISQAEARARFVASETEGRLEVTFVEFLGVWVWAAAGDYWVIGLDPEYRWSLVGEPSRAFAWILARTPTLDRETLRNLSEILEREGYDSCRLLLTAPGPQGSRGRLCDQAG